MKKTPCFLTILLLILAAIAVQAQILRGEPFVVSDAVGGVIDAEERARYGLFPEIEGFQSAAFFKIGAGSYLIRITRIDPATGQQKEKAIRRGEETIREIRQAILRKQLQKGSQTDISSRPPLNAARILGELLLGEIGFIAGGLSIMGPALAATGGKTPDGAESAPIVLSAISLSALGCAAGVWLVGTAGEQSGSFRAALLGSAAGIAGIMIGALINENIGSRLGFLPAIGGTIGFNLTRRYDVSTGEGNSFQHVRTGTWRLSYRVGALPARVPRDGMHLVPGLQMQVQF